MDHNDLNALTGIRTTAENLVHWIWDALVAGGVADQLLYRIRLWETEHGFVEITHAEREGIMMETTVGSHPVREITETSHSIMISELFGPTIQGEGALIGKPTVFVRTGGCDIDAHGVILSMPCCQSTNPIGIL